MRCVLQYVGQEYVVVIVADTGETALWYIVKFSDVIQIFFLSSTNQRSVFIFNLLTGASQC